MVSTVQFELITLHHSVDFQRHNESKGLENQTFSVDPLHLVFYLIIGRYPYIHFECSIILIN